MQTTNQPNQNNKDQDLTTIISIVLVLTGIAAITLAITIKCIIKKRRHQRALKQQPHERNLRQRQPLEPILARHYHTAARNLSPQEARLVNQYLDQNEFGPNTQNINQLFGQTRR